MGASNFAQVSGGPHLPRGICSPVFCRATPWAAEMKYSAEREFVMDGKLGARDAEVLAEHLALESRAPAQRCWEMADLWVNTTANNCPSRISHLISHISYFIFHSRLFASEGKKTAQCLWIYQARKKEKKNPMLVLIWNGLLQLGMVLIL